MELAPESEALRYYEANAQTAFDRSHDEDMEALYRPFLALLPPGGHVLDAGCGSGRDSRAFLQRGYQVTAFDGAAAMAALAARHTGLPVRVLRFGEVAFTTEFDGVWASKSLLHVRRRAMPDALGRLVRSLRPDGVLYASFMVGPGERTRGGVFFNDYTEDKLQAELELHESLEVVQMWRTADPPPSRHDVSWLNVLARKRHVHPGSSHRFTRTPHARA